MAESTTYRTGDSGSKASSSGTSGSTSSSGGRGSTSSSSSTSRAAYRNGSLADIAAGLVEDAQDLVRLEIELAKQEVKELVKSNAIAAGLFAGAGLFAMLAILVALPVLLVEWIGNHVLVALIWLVLYIVVAAVLALIGKSKLALHAPRKTIDSLKETKEWAVRQMKSPGS